MYILSTADFHSIVSCISSLWLQKNFKVVFYHKFDKSCFMSSKWNLWDTNSWVKSSTVTESNNLFPLKVQGRVWQNKKCWYDYNRSRCLAETASTQVKKEGLNYKNKLLLIKWNQIALTKQKNNLRQYSCYDLIFLFFTD